jgi:hypothetical protein
MPLRAMRAVMRRCRSTLSACRVVVASVAVQLARPPARVVPPAPGPSAPLDHVLEYGVAVDVCSRGLHVQRQALPVPDRVDLRSRLTPLDRVWPGQIFL